MLSVTAVVEALGLGAMQISSAPEQLKVFKDVLPVITKFVVIFSRLAITMILIKQHQRLVSH